MKSTLLFALVALVMVPWSCQAADQDVASLQGTWRAIEATSNGEPPPPGMLEKITLIFTGDTVSIMGAPLIRFRVDPTAKPAQIDFLNSHNQVGIYVLTGDTLKLCTGERGDRPAAFKTEKNTDHTYLLLQRARP
ncbi:MAG: TIGR03067 domain-containing protein [Chthoniobacter sp.]|uniref:TIGR03067 domain-containing protein n=1 Tax=Chthoniobacter sp. TaxID=2510640 RepID=UPI0032ABD828